MPAFCNLICTCVYELLQTSSCVEQRALHNALSYELRQEHHRVGKTFSICGARCPDSRFLLHVLLTSYIPSLRPTRRGKFHKLSAQIIQQQLVFVKHYIFT